MAVTGINNYTNTYTNTLQKNSTKETAGKQGVQQTEDAKNGTTRKTVADELSYLSKKFDDYSFVSANYSPGMKYGKSTTTNVAISPQFLTKMANDSELEDEYIKEISNMRELDEQFARGQAARGWKVVTRGWAIDKDGEMSCWSITTKDSKAKSFLQKMSEKSDEIRQKQLEKAKDTKEEKEAFLMKKYKEVPKKKMKQYTDTLSISKMGQENLKHLSSVSSMDYVNRFENEVTEVFAKEDTTQSVKSDTFEHHVNRMAIAYNKMKNSIEEKYAAKAHEPEYYVTESGKIEELTKEKELDMLNQAYENHSNFMATSTEIWSELQNFTPSVVYHKGSEQTEKEQNISESQENNAKSKENGVIKDTAYQAFLSAIKSDNQKLSQQYSGDWKDLRLNLNVSDGNRKMLNGIWDYYANKR